MHVSFRKNYVRNISTPHSDWLYSSFIAFVLWILTMINHQCEFFSKFWHFQFWLAASKIIYWQMSESASFISYRNGMWWTEGPDKLYYFLRVELFFSLKYCNLYSQSLFCTKNVQFIQCLMPCNFSIPFSF